MGETRVSVLHHCGYTEYGSEDVESWSKGGANDNPCFLTTEGTNFHGKGTFWRDGACWVRHSLCVSASLSVYRLIANFLRSHLIGFRVVQCFRWLKSDLIGWRIRGCVMSPFPAMVGASDTPRRRASFDVAMSTTRWGEGEGVGVRASESRGWKAPGY